MALDRKEIILFFISMALQNTDHVQSTGNSLIHFLSNINFSSILSNLYLEMSSVEYNTIKLHDEDRKKINELLIKISSKKITLQEATEKVKKDNTYINLLSLSGLFIKQAISYLDKNLGNNFPYLKTITALSNIAVTTSENKPLLDTIINKTDILNIKKLLETKSISTGITLLSKLNTTLLSKKNSLSPDNQILANQFIDSINTHNTKLIALIKNLEKTSNQFFVDQIQKLNDKHTQKNLLSEDVISLYKTVNEYYNFQNNPFATYTFQDDESRYTSLFLVEFYILFCKAYRQNKDSINLIESFRQNIRHILFKDLSYKILNNTFYKCLNSFLIKEAFILLDEANKINLNVIKILITPCQFKHIPIEAIFRKKKMLEKQIIEETGKKKDYAKDDLIILTNGLRAYLTDNSLITAYIDGDIQ
jgi:hypothetical protein